MKLLLRYCCIVLIFNFFFNKTHCTEITDSTVKVFNDIIVESEKLPSRTVLGLINYSEIDPEDLHFTGIMQSDEFFFGLPGIYIKDYGGMGGFKTISIRGTNSGQSLVMIDGFRINSTQNSSADLGNLPVSIFDRIELIKGGGSSVFGANAVGGIVNILTNKNTGNLKLKSSLNYGSFEQRFANLIFEIPVGEFSISGFAEHTKSDGNYPFATNQFGEKIITQRNNGDFENNNFNVKGTYNASHWYFSTAILYRKTDRGVPGSVVQGFIESEKARINEEELYLINNGSIILDSNSIIAIGLFGRYNDFEFSDKELFGIGGKEFSKSNFYSNDITLSGRYNYPAFDFKAETGLELSRSELTGDMLNPEADRNVVRNVFSFYQNFTNSMETVLMGKMDYFAAARLEYFSDLGLVLSPSLGFDLPLNNLPLNLGLSWSYNFRPPGFNELYYLNFGNDSLEAERSHSLNLDIKYNHDNNLNITLSGFYISTENLILATPSPYGWFARNIGNVLSRGFELSGIYRLVLGELTLKTNVSYTMQFVTDESTGSLTKGKQIVYQPKEIMSASADVSFYDFNINAGLLFVGFRFSAPDNSYSSILDPYLLTGAGISKGFEFAGNKFRVFFKAENIFDQSYVIIANYPMPGRMFRAGITFNYESEK